VACPQRKAEAEGWTVIWVDQSGFSLLPSVVRTYAPRGRTPILRVLLKREHLSVISGITMDAKLFLQVQERAFCSPDVVRFLKHMLRHLTGKVLVVWDGSPIHRGKVIKAFLADGAGERLQLEQLPGYAPKLNPDEGIWCYLKRVELRNVCCVDLRHLRSELRLATARLRHKQDIIQDCIREAGYHV